MMDSLVSPEKSQGYDLKRALFARPLDHRSINGFDHMEQDAQLNVSLAAKLREMADLLSAQNADGFRVAAYRRAAETLDHLATPVTDIIDKEGLEGLIRLPAIGRGIASAIVEMVETGRWSAHDRLLGVLEPEQLFQTIPGIGPDLAHRIHETLHIDTLESLENAALDGSLAEVPGMGPRRVAAVLAVLRQTLDGRRIRTSPRGEPPAIVDLLDVDLEYRRKAKAGRLRTIAPKRFNPEAEAWLPILHTERGPWTFTALYSNTQRAHELGKTKDWVVIYAHEADEPETQCTVVTETRGPLTGRRVIRGREGDCLHHYAEAE